MDLDAHASSLLNSSSISNAQRNASNYKTASRTFPRVSATTNQWDYKNIIEKLQVQTHNWFWGTTICLSLNEAYLKKKNLNDLLE